MSGRFSRVFISPRMSLGFQVAIPSYVRSIQSPSATSIPRDSRRVVAIPSYVRSIQSIFDDEQNDFPILKGRNPFVCQVDSVAQSSRGASAGAGNVAIPSYVRSIQSHSA